MIGEYPGRGSQGIDIGCANRRMTRVTEPVVPQLVRVNDQNIRFGHFYLKLNPVYFEPKLRSMITLAWQGWPAGLTSWESRGLAGRDSK